IRSGGAVVRLRLADGSTIAAAPATTLSIADDRIALSGGRISVQATHRDTTAPMLIATDHGEIAVVGTRFTVSAGAQRTCVAVSEGAVSLRSSDSAVPVAAGEYGVAAAGGPPVVHRPLISEAEGVHLDAPMTVVRDVTASGGAFVETPTAETGELRWTFSRPRGGPCRLWALVRAPDSTNDSFYAAIDGGPESIFDVAESRWSSRWQWSPVCERIVDQMRPNAITPTRPLIVPLDAGEHTLVLRGREAHTAVDRLLVTTDLSFDPERDWSEVDGGEPAR
ncbi:MAG: FecR domain-containing protein, partial [Planctomycetes bacterium]|nr:FecR domain-containing protein [Planctomycetota bacterium]